MKLNENSLESLFVDLLVVLVLILLKLDQVLQLLASYLQFQDDSLQLLDEVGAHAQGAKLESQGPQRRFNRLFQASNAGLHAFAVERTLFKRVWAFVKGVSGTTCMRCQR